MDFKEIAGLIGQYAPSLGAILSPLTGGSSALVGAGIGALTKAFGLTPDAKPEDILKTIQGDPEMNLKLIAAENTFNLEVLKLQIADTQGARTMSSDKMKITGKGDLNLYILAWTVVVGFYGLTTMLLYFSYIGKPITDNTGVLFMLLGNMATAFGIVLHFFYGSNTGSADTKQMLLNATPIKK